jgi:predicted regulator of Ras-like GTPase activity (Roadblock/LC7/MglB family)
MIIVERNRAFYVFGLLAAGLIPFVFANFPRWEIEAVYVPLIILIEAFLYVLFTMFASPQSGWTGAAIVSVSLVCLRVALNLLGALVWSVEGNQTFGNAMITLQAGNPVGIFLQAVCCLALAPYLLGPFLPGLLSPFAAAAVGRSWSSEQAGGSVGSSAPIGGYMQVYSYQELTEAFRKIVGLEGFMLYTSEGLNLWSHFEIAVDEETLALASSQALQDADRFTGQIRCGRTDRAFYQTLNHIVFNMSVTDEVRLLLFFTPEIHVSDVVSRIDLLKRTALEFFQLRDGRDNSPYVGAN